MTWLMINIHQVLMEDFLTGVIGLTVKMDSRREPEPVLTLFPAGMEMTARESEGKQDHALRKVSDFVQVSIVFIFIWLKESLNNDNKSDTPL